MDINEEPVPNLNSCLVGDQEIELEELDSYDNDESDDFVSQFLRGKDNASIYGGS